MHLRGEVLALWTVMDDIKNLGRWSKFVATECLLYFELFLIENQLKLRFR